jgi:uncharacterized protein YecE (DUF72 family)
MKHNRSSIIYINGREVDLDEGVDEMFKKEPLTQAEINEIRGVELPSIPEYEPTEKEIDDLSDYAEELADERQSYCNFDDDAERDCRD